MIAALTSSFWQIAAALVPEAPIASASRSFLMISSVE